MKNVKLALIGIVVMMMASCQMENNSPVGGEAQLFGRWQDQQTATCYRVYYSDRVDSAEYHLNTGQTMTDSYYWGKEWNTAEVQESDLVEHGNGWFMWRKTSANMLELQTMDNHGAVVPVEYTLTTLNDSVLNYTMASGKKYSYRKIASK